MRKYLIFIFLICLIALPAGATDCRITGSLEEIITNLNLIGEMLSYQDFKTNLPIEIDKCKFEIISDKTGMYSCYVNASVNLDILTDKNLNPTTMIVVGKMKNNIPYETASDWAFAVASLACMNMKLPDIWDMYMQAIKNDYYANRDITMISTTDPNYKDTWNFIVMNK